MAAASQRKLWWTMLCCGLAGWGMALAEPPKSGADAAVVQTLRKAQGMLRQLSQEKADLEARNAALEEQLKALQTKAGQLEALQIELKQAKAGLETLQGNNVALQQQISGQAARLQTVAEQQRKTLSELARHKRDNLQLVNAVAERTRWIEECTGRNTSLVQANREVLEKLGDRGFWDSFKEAEPLTGIGAVARETAVQEFRFKLEDLEVTPWKEPQPVAPALPAEPPDEDSE